MFADVVEFERGGIGIITEVNEQCSNYSLIPVPNMAFDPCGKRAWYYEREIKRLYYPSPLRHFLLCK